MRLGDLIDQHTVSLTTYRKNGDPVATPVSLAVARDGSVAYFRTWSEAGKAKRLRRNPAVQIAPSTFRGEVTGESMDATARLLEATNARAARSLVRRKHPFLHGILVPLGHRLRGLETQYYEVREVEAGASGEPSGPDRST